MQRAMLESLEMEMLKMDNKVRFILGVVKGEIVVSNRKRADLFLELKQKGFTPLRSKPKTVEPAPEPAESEESAENDEEEEEVGRGVKASDYEYLLSMPIGTLTLEKVQELLNQLDKLKNEVGELKRVTPEALWVRDLDALLVELDVRARIHGHIVLCLLTFLLILIKQLVTETRRERCSPGRGGTEGDGKWKSWL